MTVGLVAVQLLLTSVLLSESYYVFNPINDHSLVIVDEAPGCQIVFFSFINLKKIKFLFII